MVHHRLNEKESNPNPHINFIAALPAYDHTEQESARQLLRALAAQVRPIMKSHGFSVNSLEEYEHNNVFAGRNWNNGETVELVLRRPNRTFMPTFWLMSTLCHELAHIKHMNHGPAFQALWKKLRDEVRALQDKGYYGDGYWSSGTRLADSARVAGQGVEAGDLPEYMCGGAQTRQRPTTTRRRRRQLNSTAPSSSTGRQTAKRRKAGSRVASKDAFVGTGTSLEDTTEVKGKGKGTGFGKRASSKRAREERALAAEQRILALRPHTAGASSITTPHSDESDTGSQSDDDEVEIVAETDSDRRQTLMISEKTGNLDDLKSGTLWESFEQDFDFSQPSSHKSQITNFDFDDDLPIVSGSTGVSAKKRKRENCTSDDDIEIIPASTTSKAASASRKDPPQVKPSPASSQWACLVCTLNNQTEHLACSACGTPRGEESWKQP